ncbi:MAG: hypothetical protein ACRBBS_15870 [Thalassovita sp.]
MTTRLASFPLGNADSTRLRLNDGRRLLFDFADMGKSSGSDISFDLKKEIQDDLRLGKQSGLSVLCYTHLDGDHCSHSKDAFWFSHSTALQSNDRIKFDELWVPAAAIVETGLTHPDAKVVQKEARQRLRDGSGIKVFSSPKGLEDWLKSEGLSLDNRKHCIVNAGELMPGFDKNDAGGSEFFVHCPLSWKQDKNNDVVRNEDSIVLHVTIRVGGRDNRVLLGSDVNSDTLSEIVKSTKRHGNDCRLEWDVLKLFHHCSYKALNKDGKEDDPTKPVPDVKWLMEDQGQQGSIIICSSRLIPAKGSAEDNDQPPHRKAANYYKPIQSKRDGRFLVTMEEPDKPTTLEFTSSGVRYLPAALAAPTVAGGQAAASPARSGSK